MELATRYTPKEHEEAVYRAWEESGAFQPKPGKKGETFTTDWLKNMNRWLKWSKIPKNCCHLIYGGGESFETDGVKVVPWRAI